MWQAEQAAFAAVRLKFPFTWQDEHATLVWDPVSANPVVPWSNLASSHVFIRWQDSQLVENFAATWLGAGALWKSWAWQE